MKSDLIDTKQIDLNLLPIETLKEMAHDTAEQVENNAKATVQKAIDCGRYLTAIKEQLKHGEWLPWLGANWAYSQQTASRYMTISANYSSMGNLKAAKDVNEALRMIADSKPETTPRSERKSGQVEVVEPQTEPDDDPTPDPPTIRKTAKGSKKVKEADKPKTAAITPEIIDEPKESFPEEATLSDFSEQQILDFLVATADDPKRRAKRLRKVADKLDPPRNGMIPSVDEVAEYALEKGWTGFDAEKFWNHYDLTDWKYGKAKTPLKKWKTAAAAAWDNGRGWASVNSNGSGDYNGRRTSATQANGSCLGANGRPEIKPRKINYK